MLEYMKIPKNGSTTLEYAILLPVVFACILAAILVFLVSYQKALVQNLADQAAQSLSRQWGYSPLPVEELETGAYKQTTYEAREVYWHFKFWNNDDKETLAEEYLKEKLEGIGPFKPYEFPKSAPIDKTRLGYDPDYPVSVAFTMGLPSTLTVDIKTAYLVPGRGLARLIGLGECLIVEGHAQALVYDSKDMINTTDYVIQIIRGTKTYQKFMDKIAPLKENLQKLIGK